MRSYAKSLELFSDGLRLIPGGSQTNSKRPTAFALGAYPIYAAGAEGCRLTDVDGNTYIDYVGGCGPIVLGYQYPAVDQAIKEQLERGIIAGLLYPAEVEAARLLTELVPCAEMARFFKGGGEATAAAARIARAFTQKEVILNNGYRGWPDVWATAGNDRGVPKCLKGLTVNFPFGDLDALKEQFARNKGKVAAVFMNLTKIAPEPGYLQAVIDMVHENGALFVLDEVVTGFRLARGGAQEYFGVVPDLACFAKAMANGMPVAAVVGRADVMEITQDLFITITYGGEALSLAAAVATMKEIRDKDVNDHLWRMGSLLMDGMEAAAAEYEIPFRRLGFAPMCDMIFEGIKFPTGRDLWTFMLQEMATRGVLLRRGGMNCMTYSHKEADIAETVAAAREVFALLAPIWDKPDELKKHIRTIEVTPARPPA